MNLRRSGAVARKEFLQCLREILAFRCSSASTADLRAVFD